MGKCLYGFIVAWLIMLFLPSNVFATLRLNEIYPAPSTDEYEWIELYNDENAEIDLSQYLLFDLANNKIKIPPGYLSPYDFIIATSSSVLNNSGDTVYLKNNLNDVVETVSYPGGITVEKSYAKCPDGNGQWFSSNVVTKNTSNSPACLSLTPTDNPTPIPTSSLVPTTNPTSISSITSEPTVTSYNNIYLSEAMVNPQSGEKEWLEIYNDNNYSVVFDSWFIDDIENAGSSQKLFSLSIPPNGYAVFELSSAMFNNDADSVRLLDFNDSLKDSFEYSKSEKGKSWARISFTDDQYCLQEPSKNLPNNSCLDPITTASTLTPTSSPTPTVTKIKSVSPKPTVKSITNKSNLLVPSPDRHLNNQPGSVLGISKGKTINNQQLTIVTLSLVSLSHSILTIVSLFLKIKIHEGI